MSSIEALDTSVFAIQPGHSSDRTSFPRVQRLVRTLQPGYAYLEVGSDFGGSLLPHLLDPACRVAVSVDRRPERQPDERGSDCHYVGNSTARMLNAAASAADMQARLDAFTSSTSWRLTAPIRAAALLARRRRQP